MRSLRQDWSKFEINYLVHSTRAGVSAVEQGKHLGRTKNSCIGMRRRLGLYCEKNAREPYLAEYCRGEGVHQLALKGESHG